MQNESFLICFQLVVVVVVVVAPWSVRDPDFSMLYNNN